MSFIKKENLVISIGEYEKNGKTKQEYKTIGEIITMQGEDGPYQFFKLWGAGGLTEGKVFAPRSDNQQAQPAQQSYAQPAGQQQAPQQQGQHPAPPPQNQPQGQYQQPQQGHNPANGGWPQ